MKTDPLLQFKIWKAVVDKNGNSHQTKPKDGKEVEKEDWRGMRDGTSRKWVRKKEKEKKRR
jgi:hypothetical protein